MFWWQWQDFLPFNTPDRPREVFEIWFNLVLLTDLSICAIFSLGAVVVGSSGLVLTKMTSSIHVKKRSAELVILSVPLIVSCIIIGQYLSGR